MGVTNFDNLPQNIAQTRLNEARQVLNERKGSAQRVAGSNVRFFRIENEGDYAWSGQASTVSPQDAARGGAFFVVTLTSQVAPVFLSDLVVELFKSTDSGVTYLPVTDGSATYRVEPIAPIAITPYESAYFVSLGAVLNTYLAFKLQALATDDVSIDVTVRSL